MPITSGTDTRWNCGVPGELNKHQRADDKRSHARRGQCAMCGRFDIEDEQHKGDQQEDKPEPVDGQHAHAVDCQRQADRADEARNPSARAGDFDQDSLHADGKQKEGDVRVGEHQQ